MSGEVLVSFVGISLLGVVFGLLIPDNGCKNSLRILLALIITSALIKTISGIDITFGLDEVLNRADRVAFEKDTYEASGRIISELTEDEIYRLVEAFTGDETVSADCSVVWDGNGFILDNVEVLCRCENPVAVREYLALKLNVDESKIWVVDVEEDPNENG